MLTLLNSVPLDGMAIPPHSLVPDFRIMSDPISILVHHLKPSNFLSFGPENEGLELKALNLLIGPNGSGKSNFIEAVSFLRAAPREFSEVTRNGGGVGEWIWKGSTKTPATLECTLGNAEWSDWNCSARIPLRHTVVFSAAGQRFWLTDERVEDAVTEPGEKTVFYYHLDEGEPVVAYLVDETGIRRYVEGPTDRDNSSILAQLSDPRFYPELGWLSRTYQSIRIYREWSFGRQSVFREPQKADARNDILEEDFSNLGLFLNRLKTRFPAAKRALIEALKDLYDGIDDFEVSVEGGTVQVFFIEGNFSIPATRLSDGTLRYLCLLAILCDPQPPPLICIEEPELGLHPDILPTIADLLKSASSRTQLIVTTHSDILVDAMTDTPDCVVVCEKHDGKTEMNRLRAEDLKIWLEKYRLGELWIDGQLGGKRW